MTDNWATYFKERRLQMESAQDALIDSIYPAEITVAGHEVPMTQFSARTAIGQVARLAEQYGWTLRCGESHSFSGDHLQANGKIRPGKNIVHNWVQGVKDMQWFNFSADVKLFCGIRVETNELKVLLAVDWDSLYDK